MICVAYPSRYEINQHFLVCRDFYKINTLRRERSKLLNQLNGSIYSSYRVVLATSADGKIVDLRRNHLLGLTQGLTKHTWKNKLLSLMPFYLVLLCFMPTVQHLQYYVQYCCNREKNKSPQLVHIVFSSSENLNPVKSCPQPGC